MVWFCLLAQAPCCLAQRFWMSFWAFQNSFGYEKSRGPTGTRGVLVSAWWRVWGRHRCSVSRTSCRLVRYNLDQVIFSSLSKSSPSKTCMQRRSSPSLAEIGNERPLQPQRPPGQPSGNEPRSLAVVAIGPQIHEPQGLDLDWKAMHLHLDRGVGECPR